MSWPASPCPFNLTSSQSQNIVWYTVSDSKLYRNCNITDMTLATSKIICSLNATCQHNTNHIVSSLLNCDHQFKFNPLYFTGIQNVYIYVWYYHMYLHENIMCSNYDHNPHRARVPVGCRSCGSFHLGNYLLYTKSASVFGIYLSTLQKH